MENKPAQFFLGNMYFGGKIIMETANELVIEIGTNIPGIMFTSTIRIPKTNKLY